jgi:hypothetical protein
LGQLAVQFGEATGRYGALRDYIGKVVKVKVDPDDESAGEYVNGESDDAEPSDPAKPREKEIWVRRKPKRTDYEDATEAHDRGAVLVAAVFDAFLQVYRRRTLDLVRLATAGTGILPAGHISADLVGRLAREASKVAGQFLNICIRALDYTAPRSSRHFATEAFIPGTSSTCRQEACCGSRRRCRCKRPMSGRSSIRCRSIGT